MRMVELFDFEFCWFSFYKVSNKPAEIGFQKEFLHGYDLHYADFRFHSESGICNVFNIVEQELKPGIEKECGVPEP